MRHVTDPATRPEWRKRVDAVLERCRAVVREGRPLVVVTDDYRQAPVLRNEVTTSGQMRVVLQEDERALSSRCVRDAGSEGASEVVRT